MKVFRSDDINPARSLVSLRQRSNSRKISFSNEGDVRKTKIEWKKFKSNAKYKDSTILNSYIYILITISKILTFIFSFCYCRRVYSYLANTKFFFIFLEAPKRDDIGFVACDVNFQTTFLFYSLRKWHQFFLLIF